MGPFNDSTATISGDCIIHAVRERTVLDDILGMARKIL
jgi:hypothetical protein